MAARKCTEALAAAALLAAAACAWTYEDGAPPGHTGGFGEPDCTTCHSDHEKNAAGGRLEVRGLPERYAPGERYRLSVVLAHPELEAGGFQLALRTPEGEPAGAVVSPTARTRTVSADEVTYLQHTGEGRETSEDGRIHWQLEWQAPETATPVILHLAANAANDDLSALGDFIYTLERTLEPASAATSSSGSTGSSRKR